MPVFSRLHSRLPLLATIGVCALVPLSAQAGFQWVPSGNAPGGGQTAPVTPAPVTPVYTGGEGAPGPSSVPPPSVPQKQNTSAMKTLQITPAPARSAAMPPARPQPAPSPADDESQFLPMPVPGEKPAEKSAEKSVERTARISNAPENAVPVLKDVAPQNHDAINWNPVSAPREQAPRAEAPSQNAPAQDLTVPPVLSQHPASAPDLTVDTKVIMPPDAPAKAVDATAGGQQLTINPFPSVQDEPPHAETPRDVAPAPEKQGRHRGHKNPATAPVLNDAAPAVSPDAAPAAFAPVDGFGTNMPLALALQQIAPPATIFSYEPNVNPGTRVSWQGNGKAWNQILGEVLTPLNLKAHIESNRVHISLLENAATNAGPATPPPATAETQPTPEDANDSEMPLPGNADKESVNPPAHVTSPRDREHSMNEPVATQPPTKISQNDLRRKLIRDPGAEPALQQAASLSQVAPAAGNSSASLSSEKAGPPAPKALIPLLVPSSPPSAKPGPVSFNARKGDSLKETLTGWAKVSNAALVWETAHDYTLSNDVKVEGAFQDAARKALTEDIPASEAKPVMKWQPASEGKPEMITILDPAKTG